MTNDLPGISDVISGYTLTKLVGEGGFGEVYKGISPSGSVAAIKFVKDHSTLHQFQRLVKVQRAIHSDYVVRILQDCLDERPGHVIMELVEGCTFRQFINALPENPRSREVFNDLIYFIMLQVAQGLNDAHKQGVCHLDLKPSNVLISYRGAVKITDFEFSRSISGELSMSLASQGGIAGTLPYMSPEQRRGQPADAKSDIYTFGVMLFEALTGELPQPGDKPSDFIKTDVFDAVFERSFSRPRKRFANGEELCQALYLIKPDSITNLSERLVLKLVELELDNRPVKGPVSGEYWSESLPVQTDLLPRSIRLVVSHVDKQVGWRMYDIKKTVGEIVIHSVDRHDSEEAIIKLHQSKLALLGQKAGVGEYLTQLLTAGGEVLSEAPFMVVTEKSSLHPKDVAQRMLAQAEAERKLAQKEKVLRETTKAAQLAAWDFPPKKPAQTNKTRNTLANQPDPPIWAAFALLGPFLIAIFIVLIQIVFTIWG